MIEAEQMDFSETSLNFKFSSSSVLPVLVYKEAITIKHFDLSTQLWSASTPLLNDDEGYVFGVWKEKIITLEYDEINVG